MTDHPKKRLYEKCHDALAIQFCPACDRYVFYPRELCPYCLEVTPEWREARGRGKIYSYTVVRKSALLAFEHIVPYIFAVVELEEGVRIPSRIIDCAIDEVKIDMPVELVWQSDGEKSKLVFRPIRV
jgi:hypothetical protein